MNHPQFMKIIKLLFLQYFMFFIYKSNCDDNSPKVSKFEFNDKNNIFDVLHVDKDQNVKIYFSRNSRNRKENILYYYSVENKKFNILNITINNEKIIVDEIKPVSDKFFCVSYLSRYSFYIDGKFKLLEPQKINRDEKLIPHPTLHNYIAKLSENDEETFSITFSSNYGESYDMHEYEKVKKFEWLLNKEKAALIIDSTLKIINLKQINITNIIIRRCNNFKIFDSKLFLIQNQRGSEGYLDLHVYDEFDDEISDIQFPKLYRIKEVDYVDYVFKNFYISIKDKDDETCVWKTRGNILQSNRLLCHKMNFKYSDNPYFYINKRMHGLMFFNIYLSNKLWRTRQTFNNGGHWSDLKQSNTNETFYNNKIKFNFTFSDLQNIPSSYEWIDIQYSGNDISKTAYISLDNSHNWTDIPSSSFSAIVLNYGSPIVSINNKSENIQYSFDYLKSWKNIKALEKSDTLLFADRLINNDLSLYIISRDSANNNLKFMIVDFSNIFTKTCKESDFYDWQLPRNDGSCYLGQEITYKRKNITNLCIDIEIKHRKSISSCYCSLEDFGCAFNYRNYQDYCFLDKHSGIEENPRVCKEDSYYDFSQSGYHRVEDDKCMIREDNNNDIEHHSDLCVENDYTHFLTIFLYNSVYISQLKSNGEPFRKQFLESTYYITYISFNDSIALDLDQGLLYKYSNKSIDRIFHFRFSKLYYIKNDIINIFYISDSQILLYLTNNGILKGLSILTNFEYLHDYDVNSFRYSTQDQILFYVKSKYIICYGNLFEKSTCKKMKFNVKIFSVNFKTDILFIHKANNELIINNIIGKNLNNTYELYKLDLIDEFYEYDGNLYVLVNNDIIYQKVNVSQHKIKIFSGMDIKRFMYHPAINTESSEICEQRGCQFICVLLSQDEAKCVCPSFTKLNNTDCVCPKNDPDCLKPYCHGFYCKNNRCLINNVRCNGIDDCGDNSDELECKDICKKNFHLCDGKCVHKNRACVMYTTFMNEMISDNNILRYKKFIFIFAFIFVIGFLVYLGYRFFYKLQLHRNLRINSIEEFRNRLKISSNEGEYQNLLGNDSDI